MTKRQVIATLKASGLNGENIEVRGSGQNWEIEIAPAPETADSMPHLDNKTLEKIQEALGVAVGGFSTGYHAWIIRPGYKLSEADLRDYCDVASSAHY